MENKKIKIKNKKKIIKNIYDTMLYRRIFM